MKLVIERDALFKALQRAVNVVARNATIPILLNVLLQAETADGGVLRMTATDLDIETWAAAPADVEAEGAATVPAVKLLDLVRNFPSGGQVAISLGPKGQRVTVACARARAELAVLSPDDFPHFPKAPDAIGGQVSATMIARLIDKTGFAASTEETRYYLNGVFLHVAQVDDRPVLRCVATDGHRMALAEVDAPEGFEGAAGVIVPTKTATELRRLVDGRDAAEIAWSATRIQLDLPDAGLTSKLLEGNYPDYVRVIPRDNPRVARCDVTSLAQAIKRAMVIADDKSRSMRMEVAPGVLRLTARDASAGVLNEEVEAQYDGEVIEWGVNARYLAEILAHLDGGVVEFRAGQQANAGPILVLDPADKRLQFVLMPLRV